MLQRSISSSGQQNGESTRKAQDLAAIREVYKNRQSRSLKPQKPEKPEKLEKPPKIKSENSERGRHIMPAAKQGGTSSDPLVIDD